jgi:hypothetical protein
MKTSNLKTSFILSVLITCLAGCVSFCGLLFRGIYRDNAFVKTTWLGNDAITLFVGLPILIAALVFARRGSLKAQLVWMGMLDYMLYNYAFYLFGAAFNAFFLVYVALLGLSIFALIFGLTGLNIEEIHQQIGNRMPSGWIAGYMLFVALGLSCVYLAQSISFIFTGHLPGIVTTSGHPTNVVFALDLTLLVPWLVLGSVWLLRKRSWGTVIVGMFSVKGPLYTAVLALNTFLVMRGGLGGASELPLWLTLTALGTIASGLFYANMGAGRRLPDKK